MYQASAPPPCAPTPVDPCPPAAAYLVLYVPPGNYTLLERLYIERPWTVLRGAGSGASTLHFPKSLRDIYGPNPEDERGFYVNEGALVCSGRCGTCRGHRTAALVWRRTASVACPLASRT